MERLKGYLKPTQSYQFGVYSKFGTVKIVYDGKELNQSLSDMAKGFRRLMQYKKIT